MRIIKPEQNNPIKVKDSVFELGIVFLFLLWISLAIIYLGSFYLKLPFDHIVLYNAEDPGYVAPPNVSQPLIGVHRFNDYLQTMSYVELKNPYDLNLDYPSMYGPLGMLFLRPILLFPKLIGLIILSLIGLYAMLHVSVKYLGNHFSAIEKIAFAIVFVLLSRPLLLGFDRGNIQPIISAGSLLFFYLINVKKNWQANLVLVLLIGIKIYPIIFLGYFIYKKEYRRFLGITLVSALLTFLSFVVIAKSINIVPQILGLLKGMAIQSGYPTSGLSVSAWIFRILDQLGLMKFENGFDQTTRLMQLTISFLIGVFLLYISIRKIYSQKQTQFIFLAFSALISPVSWDYNIIWASIGLLMLLDLYRDNHSNFFSFRIKSYVTKAPLTTYVWLLLLIPIPWIWRGSSRINVSIADLVYFPLIALILWSWGKSEQKNKIS
jgi:hypothetical protein